jgi:hypothetical protein
VPISVPDEKIKKIKTFVGGLIKAKSSENHHVVDPYQEQKRWMTGLGGEAACEEFLKIDIIDWTIGVSDMYSVSDLRRSGYKVGVKTVEWGKFHVIASEPSKPQIMIFKLSDSEYLIGGLATVDVLSRCQEIELILSPMLRARGKKTAFTGYEHLRKIRGIQDLGEYHFNGRKQPKVMDSDEVLFDF